MAQAPENTPAARPSQPTLPARWQEYDPSGASLFELGLFVAATLYVWTAARWALGWLAGEACYAPVFFARVIPGSWGTVQLVVRCAGHGEERAVLALGYVGLPYAALGRLSFLPFLFVLQRRFLFQVRRSMHRLGRWAARGGRPVHVPRSTCIMCRLCNAPLREPVFAPGCMAHVWCRSCLADYGAACASEPLCCPACGVCAGGGGSPVPLPAMAEHVARFVAPDGSAGRRAISMARAGEAAPVYVMASTGSAVVDAACELCLMLFLLAPVRQTVLTALAATRVLWWQPLWWLYDESSR